MLQSKSRMAWFLGQITIVREPRGSVLLALALA
jgi:hypothetical protein